MAEPYIRATARETPVEAGARSTGYADRGSGWVSFAGVMLAIVGVLNFIFGIAAISDSKFYVRGAEYILSGLNTWGWIILLTGVVQFFAAFSIWGGTAWGRWVGVLTAGSNSIVQLLFLPSFPLAALAIFSVDILIIYGLVAYGGRRHATA
jgi:hypothetical protein